MCLGYKTDSYAGALNAGAVATDSLGNVPTVTTFTIGCNPATTSSYLNGHIAKINYYVQRVTNAEVQSFSKG
jgi:hypothetical protein